MKTPYLAYIPSSTQIGPDSYEDYKKYVIVWSVFEDTALISPQGGGHDTRTIHINVLRTDKK